MRIGMLADLYKPHISGVTNYIALYKKHYESLGHQVYVFTFGEGEGAEEEPNVVRSPSLPIALQYGDKDLHIGVRYNKQARRQLATMEIAHVHHPFLSGTLAIRHCKPRGIPIVFTSHTRYDLYLRSVLPHLPEGVGRVVLESYLPSFCRACDLVIAPAPGVKDMLLSLGVQAPIEVVPNGVDLTPFRRASSEEGQVTRMDLGFREGAVLFVYVGRLGPEKKLPFLIRAFAGAAEAYPEIGLLVVGDGPERENLEDRVRHMRIQDQVRFTGAVPYQQTPGYLALADVFVTASTTEVHPLSVIEAMAAGLPVLGVRGAGVGDIVEDGVQGFLARDDLASFTARLVRLIVDVEARGRMGRRAGVSAEEYSLERTAGIMFAHYQRLIEAARRENQGILKRLLQLVRRRKL